MSAQFSRAGALIFIATVMPMFGQLPVQTQKAEMSVPFGVVSGRLVTVGEYLVFVDEEKPDSSLAVVRSGLRDLTTSGDILTIETLQPVRDRSGERSKLVFRLSNPSTAPGLAAWFKEAPQTVSESAQPGKETSAATLTYQVKHDHLIGSCNGRLIIEPNRILFESITNLDHSRQWGLKDIKELRRTNPYGIKIEPFTGDTMNLQILGRGMDSTEYGALVDRITAARVRQ